MYSSTVTKELSISLLMWFRTFTFKQIKIYLVEMNTSNICNIANVNVCRYSNLIKPYNYFRTNCCLVINLNQNRFEIK